LTRLPIFNLHTSKTLWRESVQRPTRTTGPLAEATHKHITRRGRPSENLSCLLASLGAHRDAIRVPIYTPQTKPDTSAPRTSSTTNKPRGSAISYTIFFLIRNL